MFDLDTYRLYKQRLSAAYDPQEAGAMARWIVEEQPASPEEVLERLLRHEPIQHIFGYTDWRGMRLHVTPDTLIPRPETAELIDAVLAACSGRSGLRVLDIGTGSGCIALALKSDHPDWQLAACDISQGALAVAAENATQMGLNVAFFRLDVLSDELPEAYDLIVSNPPYICEEERGNMEPNVLDYEPATALFVPDADPLLFYRRIARLQTSGMVAFEINERFGDEMLAMLAEEGYSTIDLKTDICGKDRIVIAAR